MMWTEGALALAGGGGAFAASLAGLARYARKTYALRRHPDAVLSVKTMDSWHLRVLYYRPNPSLPPYDEPVILCHGLAASSYNLDFDERYSVAQYLARHGFHAFVPDLRGRDGSWPERSQWKARHDYTFDDHAGLDAPAILNAALEQTGARRAFWVGHSMGGMVGYAVAGREPEKIAGLVTFAAPARLQFDRLLGRIIEMALAVPLDPLPQRFFSQAFAPIVTETFPPFADVSVIRQNMERSVIRKAMTNVVVDLPRPLIRQFANWAWNEQPISVHGGVSYLDAISRIRAPLMCIAGAGDKIVAPADVRPAYDLARSDDKAWVCVGSGDANDPMNGQPHGHVDMVLGAKAPDTVFPVLGKWLAERARRMDQRRLVAC